MEVSSDPKAVAMKEENSEKDKSRKEPRMTSAKHVELQVHTVPPDKCLSVLRLL